MTFVLHFTIIYANQFVGELCPEDPTPFTGYLEELSWEIKKGQPYLDMSAKAQRLVKWVASTSAYFSFEDGAKEMASIIGKRHGTANIALHLFYCLQYSPPPEKPTMNFLIFSLLFFSQRTVFKHIYNILHYSSILLKG